MSTRYAVIGNIVELTAGNTILINTPRGSGNRLEWYENYEEVTQRFPTIYFRFHHLMAWKLELAERFRSRV
ncbi:hypothetical protein M7I_5199 [Glarea lozoyensis 74030]|uniref:Uncharacterized protein n=1 Tax=Glarea lozoyensis (strain ATCC 74030 / MF5533) TaxID=1104152 RepID=H0ER81_GLAL7|nr:hypothetical protein M7I_5199 [Glarea lozoyensis 74030]